MNNIKELLKKELIIPEIQRDYVWGNNEVVIKRFINNIKNMKDNDELDIGFFYSYKIYGDCNALVDGQQRITTLILLSWYVGVDNVELNKFKFKVRENSNNFLEELLKQKSEKIFEIDGKKFSDKIKNSIWYKRIWDNDPTVKSILNALDIIDIELKNNEKENIKNKINNIKFSCIKPEGSNRNLEKEYILLNSRGVKLTNSEQLKAILTEDFEDKEKWLEKWEKDWQDILWECKVDDYNTDKIWDAVLYWVRDIYVIENNIYKNGDKKEVNYNFDLIGIEKENKGKVLEILDWIIPVLKIINDNLGIIQKKCQFEEISIIKKIKDKIQGKVKEYSMEIKEKALFYSILYLIKNEYNIESIDSIKDKNIQLDNNILDKIRIFRNLIQNSNINASNLHNAVNSLKNFDINKLGELEGLDKEQQDEEALKLEIFEKYKEYKDLIINIENYDLFRGKIKKLFLLFLSIEYRELEKNPEEAEKELENNYKLKNFYEDKKDILLKSLENNKTKFKNLFDIYEKLDLKKNNIWGELLLEKDVYKSDKNYIWLISNKEYAFLKLVYLYIINVDKNISNNSIKLEEFLNKNRKEKLNIKNNEDLFEINEPKQQLYILYVIGYDKGYYIFNEIADRNKNFGIYGRNSRKFENKKIEEMSEKSPFKHKLVFQSYKEVFRGGQPFVNIQKIIENIDIQKILEEYIK